MAISLQQYSDVLDKLSKATEKLDKLQAELSYTKDQLIFSEAQVFALHAQITLRDSAKKVNKAGTEMIGEGSWANNRYSLTAHREPKTNSKETIQEEPKTTTPDLS